MNTESETKILLETITDILHGTGKYQDTTYLDEGGSKKAFLTHWGPAKQKKVAKIERLNITNPRAIRYIYSGHSTKNEINVLASIENPDKHHLVRLHDYYELEDGTMIIIEDHFPSKNLERLVKEQGPLTTKDFTTVFSQVIDAHRYLVAERNILHRDGKAGNILVNQDNGLEVRLTDFANASLIDNIEDKMFATAGSKSYTDPLSQGTFTGKPSKFTEQSEMYTIGINMLYALTGKLPFEYDPDAKTGIANRTEKLILNPDGTANRDLHNQELEAILSTLPNGSKKYANIIRKLVTLDESQRYKSINQLHKDFKKASKRKILGMTTDAIKYGLIGTSIIAALFAGLDYQSRIKKEHLQEIEERIRLRPQWQARTQTIENQFFELDIQYINVKNSDWDSLGAHYPRDNHLRVNSTNDNEELSFYIIAKERIKIGSQFQANPNLGLRIYIPGHKPLERIIHTTSPECSGFDEVAPGIYIPNFKIPENINPGTYKLIMELYALSEDQQITGYTNGELKLPETGTVIERRSIPIVIGEPELETIVDRLQFGYFTYQINMQPPETYMTFNRSKMETKLRNAEDLTLKYSVPEIGFSSVKKYNSYINIGDLPRPTDNNTNTLQIVVYHDGEPISEDFFPITRGIPENYNQNSWQLALYTDEWIKVLTNYTKSVNHEQTRQ
ncbi:MAG: protein kinase domain-containing protein [Candidatus Woesearchaeota archaeon]